MESLEISLLHKAFVSQSKSILLFFLALLLLMLAFLHMETRMPTIWPAFTGFFEGPVFAFLLLNCLIVTIIASTKLESHEKGEHERESMREGDGKGLFIAEEENVTRRGIIAGQSHIYNSSIYDYDMNEGKDFVGISCSRSLNANFKDQIIKQEPISVTEKKPIMRAYRVEYRTRSDEVGLLPNYKPLMSDFKAKKLMRGSFSFNDGRAAGLEKSQKTNDNKGLGHPAENIDIIDHQSRQGKEPAAAAAAMTHPSLEEAWAAIMLAKKNDHYMQPADQCIKGSNYGNDNQALAAARTRPAAATNTPRPPAAAAANPLRSPQAVPKTPERPSDAPAAAIEKHELDADDHEHDSELEELNRRAEEFIARFNNQMRLQHQESLQRIKGRHRPPTCNHHHIQYSNSLQLPPPGLLVG